MPKNAIVTGGARGIGVGLVVKLAEMGYNVTVNYTTDSSKIKAEKLVKEIEDKYSVKGLAFQADVADYEACGKLIDGTLKAFGGRIDILVNNAGMSYSQPFLDITPEMYRRLVDVNLIGCFNTCHIVLPGMIEAKDGCIINIASISGQLGYKHNVEYSASKGGVISFTRSLALEMCEHKIRVNQIAPGLIATDLTQDILKSNPEVIESFKETIPMRFIGEPIDIAEAMEYLINARYVTGETISVNGGTYMS